MSAESRLHAEDRHRHTTYTGREQPRDVGHATLNTDILIFDLEDLRQREIMG
jgi:hypothetical protein